MRSECPKLGLLRGEFCLWCGSELLALGQFRVAVVRAAQGQKPSTLRANSRSATRWADRGVACARLVVCALSFILRPRRRTTAGLPGTGGKTTPLSSSVFLDMTHFGHHVRRRRVGGVDIVAASTSTARLVSPTGGLHDGHFI
jgi:hypothetical protein